MLWRSSSSSQIPVTGRWAVSPAYSRRCVCCVIGSCRHVVARVLCRHRFCACGPANMFVDDFFKWTLSCGCRRGRGGRAELDSRAVVSLFNGSMRNGRSNGCAHERDPARVVSDFVMCHSSAAASANGAPGDEIRSRCRLRSSSRRSGDCPIIA
jgi:hypothetical protein